MSNAESFGFGYGAREEVGEHLLTWILKPGTYKITLNGQSFNTYIDFTTVELVKGELVQLTMVVDSESGHLIGAGILNQEENILLNFNGYRMKKPVDNLMQKQAEGWSLSLRHGKFL